MSRLLFFALFLFLFSCKETKQEVPPIDYIIPEKDLIPEGVAYDSVTHSIFVSSTYKRKILRIDSAGAITNFISEKKDGIWSTIGMEVDPVRRQLWAISSQASDVLPLLDPGPLQWRSALYQYDIASAELIRAFLLQQDSVFLNDLTIASNGDVYLTETMKGNVYKLAAGADSMVLFLSPKPYTFLNGISFAGTENYLFIASTEGIIKLDMATMQYKLLKTKDINAEGIDGLTYYKGSLIGHQSKKVVKFILDNKEETITKAVILNTGTEFDSSTTGEINGDDYYFIVNSQVRSGIDFSKKEIKPMDSLENVIIRKIRL